jgi:hypothetical protein
MEIEKFIFVLMIIVGILVLILSVSLIVKEDHKEVFSFGMNSGKINYPTGSSGSQVLLSSEVNARNYCNS